MPGNERQMGLGDELSFKARELDREALMSELAAKEIDSDIDRLDHSGRTPRQGEIDRLNELRSSAAETKARADELRRQGDMLNPDQEAA